MTGKWEQTQAAPGGFPRAADPAPIAGPDGFPDPDGGAVRDQLCRRPGVLLAGAWPVIGFFGLDVALIYLAFKLNYRSGRLYETIELTPGAVHAGPGCTPRDGASSSTAIPIGRA